MKLWSNSGEQLTIPKHRAQRHTGLRNWNHFLVTLVNQPLWSENCCSEQGPSQVQDILIVLARLKARTEHFDRVEP